MFFVFFAAMLMMIVLGYQMKGAYQFGLGLQEECGNEYMEKERADFHAYQKYKKDGNNLLKKVFEMLAYTMLVVIVCYIIWLVSAGAKMYADDELWVLPKGRITKDGIKLPFMNHIIVPIAIFSYAIAVMAEWIKATITKRTAHPIYSTVNYGRGATDALLVEKEKARIKKIQTKLLIMILVLFVVCPILFNPISKQDTMPLLSINLRIALAIISVISFIFIPMVSDVMLEFKLKVGGWYSTKQTDLNTEIQSEIGNEKVKYEIQRNIVKDDPTILTREGGGIPEINTSSVYYNKLYEYAMHTLNYADIMGIYIPKELKPVLNPRYLKGEYIIELKRRLSEVYQTQDGNALTPELLNNTQTSANKLVKFLAMDFQTLLKKSSRTDSETSLLNEKIALLNNLVINNNLFAKANPLFDTAKEQMRLMRKDSEIGQTVKAYYKKINITVMSIVFLIVYMIYHKMYIANPDQTVQKVSLIIFILLLIIGFIGWFFKELWI